MVKIHHVYAGDAALDEEATQFFRTQWAAYRRLVDANYAHHRGAKFPANSRTSPIKHSCAPADCARTSIPNRLTAIVRLNIRRISLPPYH